MTHGSQDMVESTHQISLPCHQKLDSPMIADLHPVEDRTSKKEESLLELYSLLYQALKRATMFFVTLITFMSLSICTCNFLNDGTLTTFLKDCSHH